MWDDFWELFTTRIVNNIRRSVSLEILSTVAYCVTPGTSFEREKLGSGRGVLRREEQSAHNKEAKSILGIRSGREYHSRFGLSTYEISAQSGIPSIHITKYEHFALRNVGTQQMNTALGKLARVSYWTKPAFSK